MTTYSQYTTKPATTTPQNQPIPGREADMVPNSAGGYVFQVGPFERLERFLVLGSDSPTYYSSARELTVSNAKAIQECIALDGFATVRRIVDISESGRAPKNDPAIFALALCAAVGGKEPSMNDRATRRAALEALPRVCRIPTHLFQFVEYVQNQRGWGRALRAAVANWYAQAPVERLAYHSIKYRQRDGWTHRDLFRLAHPQPGSLERLETIGLGPTAKELLGDTTRVRTILYNYLVNGWPDIGNEPHPLKPLDRIWAFEKAQQAKSVPEIVPLIREYDLPREAIPTQFLTAPSVWEALLHAGKGMPMTALLRNLGTMSRLGLLDSVENDYVRGRLTSESLLRAARIHPLSLLVALKTYQQGHGVRGKSTWPVNSKIVDALDAAFYLSFGNVPPMGGANGIVLALDVSGSMSGPELSGMPGITPRVGSAAMAMVTAHCEPHHEIIGFTGGPATPRSASVRGYGGSYSTGKSDPGNVDRLDITPRRRLDDIVRYTDSLPMGGTDCALPMLWAEANNVKADAFLILTDNESWAGSIQPIQALNRYRQKTGIPAKLVVVAMTATEFSVADPNDAGCLDVVGFDTAAPAVVSQFISGQPLLTESESE